MNHREQFITDVIRHYKKNHAKEFNVFKQIVKDKRKKMFDKNTGRTTDKKGRITIRLPEGLHTALDMSMDNPRFLSKKKEIDWFAKRFPEFVIPYTY